MVGLHSLWRWVVLIVLLVAIVRGVMGWLRGGAWTSNDRTLALVTTIVLDIQLLLGLAVYGSGKFWQSDSKFLAYVHPLVMIVAIVIVHVTSVLIRRTELANAKFRTLTIGLLVATVLITAAIPSGAWSRIWA